MPASWRTLPARDPVADFHIESDVKPVLAYYLSMDGHTSVTPRDLDMWRTSEAIRLLTAAENRRIVVTHNWKAFFPLHTAWVLWANEWYRTAATQRKPAPVPVHAGILVIPQTWDPRRAAAELNRFLLRRPPLPNTLHAWIPRRGWVVYP